MACCLPGFFCTGCVNPWTVQHFTASGSYHHCSGGIVRTLFWLYRWMLFRVMFGAGLIKIRGDECWRNLTCLAYHYETQPLPNPISWYLHHMPLWFHKSGLLFNHFSELIVPWFYFAPRRLRH